MSETPLTYKEFLELALQNYCNGGDTYYECWESYEFDYYVKEFGPITRSSALEMFALNKTLSQQY